jgi:hypothetical protein
MENNSNQGNIVCLVCSCEKTKDIAKYMMSTLFLFDEDRKIITYIGCEIDLFAKNQNYKYIATPQTDWKRETIFQLEVIKKANPNLKNILLLLDDFMISSSINTVLLADVKLEMEKKDIKYLMIKPTYDSFIQKIFDFSRTFKLVSSVSIYKVRRGHPYYFSLQACIWDIDYLIENIASSKSIWDFENMVPKNEVHYAVSKPLLNYKHIVEKGEWDFSAKRICINTLGYFEAGVRKSRDKKFPIIFMTNIKKISFFFFGYTFLKIKKIKSTYKIF